MAVKRLVVLIMVSVCVCAAILIASSGVINTLLPDPNLVSTEDFATTRFEPTSASGSKWVTGWTVALQ